MPLTFAHPAAIIPIKKLWPRHFCWPGLIIGSMAPDFEYFLQLRTNQTISHTWWGMFVMDLPLACLAAWVSQRWLLPPIILNLPDRFRFALESPENIISSRSWINLRFMISALVGIITHLLWDACTHRRGWLVQLIPALRVKVPFWHNQYLPKFLHNVCSILGVVIIFFCLAICLSRALKTSSPFQSPAPGFNASTSSSASKQKFWLLAAALTFIFWVVALAYPLLKKTHFNSGDLAVCLTDGVLFGPLVAGLWFNRKRKQFRIHNPS